MLRHHPIRLFIERVKHGQELRGIGGQTRAWGSGGTDFPSERSIVRRLRLFHFTAGKCQDEGATRHEQSHDVFKPGSDTRVQRQIGSLSRARRQTMGPPMARYARRADSKRGGHRAGTPGRRCIWASLGGQAHQLLHVHAGRRSAPRQIALDARKPELYIAFTPAGDLHPPDIQLSCDLLVLHTPGCKQHNARALRQPRTAGLGFDHPRQISLLIARQHNFRHHTHD